MSQMLEFDTRLSVDEQAGVLSEIKIGTLSEDEQSQGILRTNSQCQKDRKAEFLDYSVDNDGMVQTSSDALLDVVLS